VLEILVAALDDAEGDDHVYDIGGRDVLSYEEMMHAYAEVAGLTRRVVVPVPLFSVHLAPRSIGLVTPLPEMMVRPLIESLRDDVVVEQASPPGFDPSALFAYRESVRLALIRISEENVETRWSDAVTQPALPLPGDPSWSGAVMEVDRRTARSSASTEDLFWAVTRIGGDVGYYSMDWAWQLRGWFDSLIGGVGLRRGRRHPVELRPGEALDFFRVAEMDPMQHRLTLRVEDRTDRGRVPSDPVGPVRAAGLARPSLLVGSAAFPRTHLPHDGPAHRGNGRATGASTARSLSQRPNWALNTDRRHEVAHSQQDPGRCPS
jgi:hypothetical protein